jgi:hypothetical protein
LTQGFLLENLNVFYYGSIHVNRIGLSRDYQVFGIHLHITEEGYAFNPVHRFHYFRVRMGMSLQPLSKFFISLSMVEAKSQTTDGGFSTIW